MAHKTRTKSHLGRWIVVMVLLGIVGSVGLAMLRSNPLVLVDIQVALRDKSRYDAGRLDPELERRWAVAAVAAKKAGHNLSYVTAYRSWEQQLSMYREGIVRHGSIDEARKRVLPPWESMHVRGLAIDLTHRKAGAWLTASNGRYGLCQRYDNEWWHFEMLGGVGEACPTREADASGGNRDA